MRFKALMVLVAGGALLGAAACGGGQPAQNGAAGSPTANQPGATNGNSPAGPTNAADGDTTKLKPTILKQEDGPDNSRVVVKQINGRDQVEVRTWAAGPVERLTRFTNAQKKRLIRIKLREGARYRVEDPQTVERALELSGAQLADAAKRLGKPMGAAAADDGDADEKDASTAPADGAPKK